MYWFISVNSVWNEFLLVNHFKCEFQMEILSGCSESWVLHILLLSFCAFIVFVIDVSVKWWSGLRWNIWKCIFVNLLLICVLHFRRSSHIVSIPNFWTRFNTVKIVGFLLLWLLVKTKFQRMLWRLEMFLQKPRYGFCW